MSSTNTYAPSFVVKVAGTELRHGITVDVLSVSVTDTANQADSFSITMRDRHPEPARFPAGARLEWIDSGLLDEGQEVEIRLGYVDHLDFKFRGDITAVSANFPESGVPTLSVRGFSRYHCLQRLRCKKTAFVSKTVSEIARDIARLANLQAHLGAFTLSCSLKSRRQDKALGEGFRKVIRQPDLRHRCGRQGRRR